MSNRQPSHSAVRLIPPTTVSASSTVAAMPRCDRTYAPVSPAGPAPMMTTSGAGVGDLRTDPARGRGKIGRSRRRKSRKPDATRPRSCAPHCRRAQDLPSDLDLIHRTAAMSATAASTASDGSAAARKRVCPYVRMLTECHRDHGDAEDPADATRSPPQQHARHPRSQRRTSGRTRRGRGRVTHASRPSPWLYSIMSAGRYRLHVRPMRAERDRGQPPFVRDRMSRTRGAGSATTRRSDRRVTAGGVHLVASSAHSPIASARVHRVAVRAEQRVAVVRRNERRVVEAREVVSDPRRDHRRARADARGQRCASACGTATRAGSRAGARTGAARHARARRSRNHADDEEPLRRRPLEGDHRGEQARRRP